MGDYGFKYSLPGKSVLRSDNPKEIGYSSEFQTLETHKQGYITQEAGADGYTNLDIFHGLPYRPAFNVYFRDTLTGEIYQCSSVFDEVEFNRAGAEINVHAASNNYNLVLTIYNSSNDDKDVDLFYEIFVQDLTTEPQFFFG